MPDPQPPSRKRGVVAIFDLLGVRARWREEGGDPLRLASEIRDFARLVAEAFKEDSLYKGEITLMDPEYVAIDWSTWALSDTVLLTGMYDLEPDSRMMNQIGNHLVETFYTAIDRGFLLRGALSIGTYFQADQVVVGPAIDDVAYWYERAEWAGIMATPTMSELMERPEIRSDAELLFAKWNVSMKTGPPIETWALWWPRERQRASIDRIFTRAPMDESTARKRTETIRFYNEMMNRMYPGFYDQETGLVRTRPSPPSPIREEVR